MRFLFACFGQCAKYKPRALVIQKMPDIPKRSEIRNTFTGGHIMLGDIHLQDLISLIGTNFVTKCFSLAIGCHTVVRNEASRGGKQFDNSISYTPKGALHIGPYSNVPGDRKRSL